MKYMIWSNEHTAWLGPSGWGYTTLTHSAGRFSFKDAERFRRNDDAVVLAADQDWCDQQFWDAVRASINKGRK